MNRSNLNGRRIGTQRERSLAVVMVFAVLCVAVAGCSRSGTDSLLGKLEREYKDLFAAMEKQARVYCAHDSLGHETDEDEPDFDSLTLPEVLETSVFRAQGTGGSGPQNPALYENTVLMGSFAPIAESLLTTNLPALCEGSSFLIHTEAAMRDGATLRTVRYRKTVSRHDAVFYGYEVVFDRGRLPSPPPKE